MKRLLNILILLCGGGAIIIGWIVIPGRLLEKQRQEVFCSRVAVSIENVHPYGEEYSILRNKLRQAIECKTSGQYAKTSAVSATEYADVTKKLMTEYRKFLNSWDGLGEHLLDGDAEPENLYLCLQEGECNLAVFSNLSNLSAEENQNMIVQHVLYVEPSSGIPVSGSVFLNIKRPGITVNELWSGLLAAYTENLGIPVLEISVDDKPIKQNSMEVYDTRSSTKEKVIDVNQILYAESADGSCRIQGSVYWFSTDEFIFDFELNIH